MDGSRSRDSPGFTRGRNRFGKDPACDIPLPDGPAQAGVFEFHHGKVMLNGREIKPDDAGEPIHVGRVNLFVIQRSDKVGIRVKIRRARPAAISAAL